MPRRASLIEKDTLCQELNIAIKDSRHAMKQFDLPKPTEARYAMLKTKDYARTNIAT